MSKKIKALSSWSIFLSLLCAIHCMAMPILIATVSFAGMQFISDPFYEVLIILGSILLAVFALFSSYNNHKNINPMLIFGLSLFLVLPGLLIHNHNLIALGSVFSAVALFYNWQVNRRCENVCCQS